MTPEDATEQVVEAWMRLAGKELAYEVAVGKMCDRCARAALRTIVLSAAGVGRGAGTAARMVRLMYDGYGEELTKLSEVAVAMLARPKVPHACSTHDPAEAGT